MTETSVLPQATAGEDMGAELDELRADMRLLKNVVSTLLERQAGANGTYEAYEAEARDRVPGDPDDWHTVALALACGTEIRTNETLRRRLAAGRLAPA